MKREPVREGNVRVERTVRLGTKYHVQSCDMNETVTTQYPADLLVVFIKALEQFEEKGSKGSLGMLTEILIVGKEKEGEGRYVSTLDFMKKAGRFAEA